MLDFIVGDYLYWFWFLFEVVNYREFGKFCGNFQLYVSYFVIRFEVWKYYRSGDKGDSGRLEYQLGLGRKGFKGNLRFYSG